MFLPAFRSHSSRLGVLLSAHVDLQCAAVDPRVERGGRALDDLGDGELADPFLQMLRIISRGSSSLTFLALLPLGRPSGFHSALRRPRASVVRAEINSRSTSAASPSPVAVIQSREQQRDDSDRLDHTKPHSGLIPHISLPDREKVCIAAISSVKFFNKLYLYQCPTYGTGLR
jgi:hypothetical protein